MEILYISTVNSNRKYNDLFNSSNGEIHHSIQKFHHLIVSGLQKNSNNVTVLSGLQISSKTNKKRIFLAEKEEEENIKYRYPFFINLPILKQIGTIISFIYFFIIWFIKNKGEKRVIIDAAYVSVAPVIVFFCKLFNVNTACVVADIYNYMSINVNTNKKRSIFEKLSCKICSYCFNNYDYFILLTKEMNNVINLNNKPYLVMEGLVDSEYVYTKKNKSKKKAIMYAGGLNEKYGVKLLIDAFNEWENKEFELWLCGSGELCEYISSLKNPRIKYYGILTNDEVLKLEKKAMLLVNPRFTNEEYTKYSFPSKNMEYMLSATPVLTTKLPGMPKEYNDYVYLIEKETKKEIINKFNQILLQDYDTDLGYKAQKFVLEEKNNIAQTKKITNFINQKVKKNNYIWNLL